MLPGDASAQPAGAPDDGAEGRVPGVTVDHLKQAAEWYATLADASATEQDRTAWNTWLAQSAAHAKAWEHIEAVSRKFDPLRRGNAGGTVAIAGVNAARRAFVSRRHVVNSVAGLLGLGSAMWLGWRYTPLPTLVAALRADYATGTGERRELALADGSRVWLNTSTALRVDYQDATRRLVLLAGEILIETARDGRGRPFFVQTPAGRLQALGTRFSVQLQERQTRLDVFDGAVEIFTQSGEQGRVDAGGAALFDAHALTPLASAAPMRAAWSKGILPADDMPLGELLAELNRYRSGHISVAPEVAGWGVMGVYPIDDTDRALDMLAQALPIRIHRPLPWWITVDAR